MKNMILEKGVLLQCSVTILPTVCHSALFLSFLSFPFDYITNRGCYDARSQYFPQSVTARHFISFFLFHLITSLIRGWHSHRQEDIIKGNLRKFDEFKAQLEQRFSDPIRPQQALNEIHSFTQGKMSAQAFLDKFEILKGISGLRDEESLYLLR